MNAAMNALSKRYPGFDRVPPRWRPSIHMPRWAARLTLRVVDVRLDPIQAITDDDAVRDGFTDRGAFLAAWQSIYGDVCGECWRIAFAVEETLR